MAFTSNEIVVLQVGMDTIDHATANVLSEIQMRTELGDIHFTEDRLTKYEEVWRQHVKRINEESARLLVELWDEEYAARTRKRRAQK
jgi:hypothetical protein